MAVINLDDSTKFGNVKIEYPMGIERERAILYADSFENGFKKLGRIIRSGRIDPLELGIMTLLSLSNEDARLPFKGKLEHGVWMTTAQLLILHAGFTIEEASYKEHLNLRELGHKSSYQEILKKNRDFWAKRGRKL